MGRVINPETAGKERSQLSKAVQYLCQQLSEHAVWDAPTVERAAYVVLCLREIGQTVEVTVAAWEKRDFWVKAEKFRQEWGWAARRGSALQKALLTNDWAAARVQVLGILQQLSTSQLPKRDPVGTAWMDSLAKLPITFS
jgi:hypothetical protein